MSHSLFTLNNPAGLYDPAPNGYSHVASVAPGARLVFVAGQGGEDEQAAAGSLPGRRCRVAGQQVQERQLHRQQGEEPPRLRLLAADRGDDQRCRHHAELDLRGPGEAGGGRDHPRPPTRAAAG